MPACLSTDLPLLCVMHHAARCSFCPIATRAIRTATNTLGSLKRTLLELFHVYPSALSRPPSQTYDDGTSANRGVHSCMKASTITSRRSRSSFLRPASRASEARTRSLQRDPRYEVNYVRTPRVIGGLLLAVDYDETTISDWRRSPVASPSTSVLKMQISSCSQRHRYR